MKIFSKKIIDFEDKLFGIDISDSSIKVVQLEKNGSLENVRSFSHKKTRKGIVENGKIVKEDELIQAIKETIKSAGPKKINTKKVICSVPESKVFLRTINIPKINEDEASEAIKWEIEANIPLSVDQVYFDWQFLEEEGDKQSVLTIAVSKNVIDELLSVLEKSGLEVYGFEMESVASVRSLTSTEEKETCLIVDIGGERTSFIISKEGVPFFTSSIPFSSAGITDVISNKMNVDFKEAEKIKTNQGVEHSLDNDAVFNSVKPFLENLSVEIEKTMDFYNNMEKSPQEINKIIISGGGANLKGLIPYLTQRLSREISMGAPWGNLALGKNLPIINREKSASFATAIGLAMWKDRKKIRLNLIPFQIKEKISKKERLKILLKFESGIIFTLLVFLLVLGSFWYSLRLNFTAQSSIEKNQNETGIARYKKIEEYDQKFSEVNMDVAKIIKVKEDQLYWSNLFSKLNQIVFPGISLNKITTADWAVNISGFSDTRENLILFKEKLENEECFSNINLPLSNLVEKNNFSFQIDFKIKKECLKEI